MRKHWFTERRTDGQTDRQMQALNIIVAAEFSKLNVPFGCTSFGNLCVCVCVWGGGGGGGGGLFFHFYVPINLHLNDHFGDQKW